MRVSLLYVTYGKDFKWLVFSLRSVEKFASGFSEVVILVPNEDLRSLKELVSHLSGQSGIPIRCVGGDEWSGKGFLWHEAMICRGDQICPDADIICHFDPDVVFTEPVTPQTFITGTRPLLRYESFKTIGVRHPAVLKWKDACEACLPFKVEAEFMRGHPHCYTRQTYVKTREAVNAKTRMLFDDYVKTCENSFPQSYAEHPTLGAVAYQYLRDDYILFDCAKQANPDYCHYPCFQAWSHSDPHEPVDLWYKGVQQKIVPADIYKELGIYFP